MSVLTSAIFNQLADDPVLAALLATYEGNPAVFTMDPAPGDATLPYIVTAGEATSSPNDTKTTLGLNLIRDVRCYAEASGSSVVIELIANRVRLLLHRQEVDVNGYQWVLSIASGPIVADEPDAYGRIVSLNVLLQSETQEPPDVSLGAFSSGFSAGFK